jgi:F0F1-type ATP synthase assembly protein I
VADPGPILRFGRSFALFWDFVGTVLAGAFVGWFIDSRFDTEPYATLGLVILGVVGGFLRLMRSLRRLERHDDDVE